MRPGRGGIGFWLQEIGCVIEVLGPQKSMKTLIVAGTKKGLFVFTSSDRQRWQLHGPFQNGREINHALYDARSGRIYAASNDSWFGCEVVWSSDLGTSWTTAKQNPAFPEASGKKLE